MSAEKPVTRISTGVSRGRYWEATKEGRGNRSEYTVSVWKGDTKEGEPSHEWVMPGVLGLELSVSQAIAQSKD